MFFIKILLFYISNKSLFFKNFFALLPRAWGEHGEIITRRLDIRMRKSVLAAAGAGRKLRGGTKNSAPQKPLRRRAAHAG